MQIMIMFTVKKLMREFHKKTFSDLNVFFFSAAAKEAGTDNRNIVDDGKSQKLTRDDIEMLKEQGLKGQVHPLSSTYLKLITIFNVQIQQ